MNNKGFTLMEILGVITLLAILSTLIILSVNKSLKDSKETLYQQQIEEIKAAAGMWRTDNIEIIPDNDYYIVSLQQLKDEGYIKKDIINPKTDAPFDNITLGVSLNDIKVDSQDSLLTLSGYTRLDYIKSTGTQYIILDYKAKTNTEIRLDIQFVENDNTNLANQSNNIIGRDQTDGINTFSINFGSLVNQRSEIFYWVDKTYASGEGEMKSKGYNSLTPRSTMTVKSGSATFQDATLEVATKTADNTENMVLLGNFNTTQNKVVAFNRYDAKVYGFQIYEGETLVRNFVPYKKNNEAGLYDLVNNKFYTSDGTGSFEYGELN